MIAEIEMIQTKNKNIILKLDEFFASELDKIINEKDNCNICNHKLKPEEKRCFISHVITRPIIDSKIPYKHIFISMICSNCWIKLQKTVYGKKKKALKNMIKRRLGK